MIDKRPLWKRCMIVGTIRTSQGVIDSLFPFRMRQIRAERDTPATPAER